jgi:tripartite-type tricarboxylate transporter receptor subunit TctC
MKKFYSILAFTTAALACAPAAVQAQKPAPGGYPSKPVKILIPLAAGGGVDTLVRAVGLKLAERWGAPIVVDNRPSSGGVVAMEMLAQAAPDGYTLLSTGSQIELVSVYYRAGWNKVKPGISPDFDVLKAFEPVVEMTSQPYLLVVPSSLPVRSVKELVAMAKAKPGELNYSTAGVGTPGHLGHEYLNSIAGVKMTHVPYKGGGAALTDLLAGRVQLTFMPTLTATNLVKQGSVRALGVTSTKRLETLPDVPTIAEAGVANFELTNNYGLFTTANTPPAVMNVINKEVTQVLFLPDMRAMLAAASAIPQPAHTPAQYKAKVEGAVAKWSAVVKSSGMTPE